jgi:hypothetical protein
MPQDLVSKHACARRLSRNGNTVGLWEDRIYRCYLPQRFAEVLAVGNHHSSGAQGMAILLGPDEILLVADDLQHVVGCAVRPSDLVCLRLDTRLVMTVDFLDGRPPLVK